MKYQKDLLANLSDLLIQMIQIFSKMTKALREFPQYVHFFWTF
jgi:hypothetical protein